MSRTLSVKKKVFFSAIVIVGFVSTAEITCRLFKLGTPLIFAPIGSIYDLHRTDPELLWDGEFYVLDQKMAGPGNPINPDGMRDREHAIANPTDATRIACLGDSVTYGYLLPAWESYSALLEMKLRKLGRKVEVFNIAIFGWSTQQQRIAYQRIARKYRPDYVVLGICLNDIAEMQNNFSQPPQTIGWLYQRSYLIRFIVGAHRREIRLIDELFEVPEPPKVQEAWRLIFNELTTLANEVHADGAELIVLVFPFRYQTMEGAPEPRPQRSIESFCADKGLPFVDALPVLEPYGYDGFVDYDHLSLKGAESIADHLIDTGLFQFDVVPKDDVVPNASPE